MSMIEISIDDKTLSKLEKLTKTERKILIADMETALKNRVEAMYRAVIWRKAKSECTTRNIKSTYCRSCKS